MFNANVQRFADVCSRDSPCWRAKSGGITEVKDGKVYDMLSKYTETISIHNRITVNFFLETLVRNKAST
jgi:hypothetical protein